MVSGLWLPYQVAFTFFMSQAEGSGTSVGEHIAEQLAFFPTNNSTRHPMLPDLAYGPPSQGNMGEIAKPGSWILGMISAVIGEEPGICR